ncbi:VOC family protein [Gordonia mangrovi]|uniref:VOC family protein n=1 Tax=Gordonia mangrovi TaxID=2665643 RepID=UPI001F2B516B|nr:VOC family protein [Gordonia mangrovi]UVF76708.1 VOC family protein [Gordonia mangrovi]
MRPARLMLQEDGDVAGVLRHTAVSHIGLQVPDVKGAAEFYSRVLGLVVHEELAGGVLRMGWGLGHHVLDLRPGERALAHYAFEVRDTDGLASIRKRLQESGIGVEDGDASFVDSAMGDVEIISTRDPDGNTVQFHSAVWRQGEAAGSTKARPVKYQHITIGSADVPAMAQFFTDVIGFRITDQLVDGKFAWLRSDRDHHSLAVVDVGRAGNIDHYSYDLAEWEDFKAWCDRLTDLEVPVSWGPGRHGPGNNLFVFFEDPAGNHVELSAEMEKFHDDRAEYVARQWTPQPSTVNLWGGQLPTWRHIGEAAQ